MNERELLQPQTDQLHVFISSRMQELEDLRAHLHRELEKVSIAFTRCGELNCYGMVDAQIAAVQRELLVN